MRDPAETLLLIRRELFPERTVEEGVLVDYSVDYALMAVETDLDRLLPEDWVCARTVRDAVRRLIRVRALLDEDTGGDYV